MSKEYAPTFCTMRPVGMKDARFAVGQCWTLGVRTGCYRGAECIISKDKTDIGDTDSTKNSKDPKDRAPSVSGKQHLSYFAEDNEFIAAIMEYIKNEKLLGTYVGTDEGETIKGFYKYIFNDRIRPTYLLHRTVTGRSASACSGCPVQIEGAG